MALRQWLAFQNRFDADLAQNTPASLADAITLEAGTGAFRQQGWVVVNLLLQLQASAQANANAVTDSAIQASIKLVWILAGMTAVALFLTISAGVVVMRRIGTLHDRVVQANGQLSTALSEIQQQHDEIQAQQETLLQSNAELEHTIQVRLAAEAELASALEESQRTRDLLTTVFETVREGIAIFDYQGAMVYCNVAAQQIMHLSPTSKQFFENRAGLHRLITLDGTVLTPEQYPTMRVLRGEPPAPPANYQMILADGTSRIVQMEAAPLVEQRDHRRGSLSVVRDITAEFREALYNDILRALARACASAADEEAIGAAAVQVLGDGFKYSQCAILLRNREQPEFAVVLASHTRGERSIEWLCQTTARVPIAPDAPLAALQVLATGDAQFTAHPTRVAAEGERADASPPWSAASIPIVIDAQVAGVLMVTRETSLAAGWESDEKDILQTITDELGLALHRAQLYEDARRLALFDPLTGLCNHRAMQYALQHEVDEATAHATPFTVIMLDIDHFRQFNERSGHDAGDRALRIVAQAIQSAIRAQDCAARYGGEEFTIILPDTTLDQAASIAERIRAAIAGSRVPTSEGQERATITASLGVATFPADARTAMTVLKAADVALYVAKHQGRDQVALYATCALSVLETDRRKSA